MAQVKVVCQNCNTPGTFDVGAVTDGNSYGRCKRCHKSFQIHLKDGKVIEVIKPKDEKVKVKDENVKVKDEKVKEVKK